MQERWYRNAAIYSLDVCTFQDSNDDGFGDLPGLISRLDYLSRLGVTALWLSPIHPSPRRDGGYDVVDHYGVDPRFGSMGDFAELLNQADERGLRIMIDLVVNHTSDEHPWFQAARSSPDSPFRDWYVWSEEEPADRWRGAVFPDVEPESWSYDEKAGAWFRHRFYRFEPDLNTSNPQVRAEIRKIAAFWLRLGVSGFRVDAAPFLIEDKTPGRHYRRDYEFLRDLRDTLSWQKGDAVMLAEANVADDELLEYFGEADGSASRILMLFAFRLNQAVMLALARRDAQPIRDVLRELPELPQHAQWATFLRNHDEVDLGRLTEEERQDVFAAFGPDPGMQLYDRGIRRRLAPMLDGDQRRLRMAYSLQFTMPGTPVVRYGDEIGMGEDLSLPERTAIRTPMQWSGAPGAGFTSGDATDTPLITEGPYAVDRVNVTDQRRDPDSLLMWFERILHTLRECKEIGTGHHEVLDAGPPHVLVHRATSPSGAMLFLHNLGSEPCRVAVDPQPEQDDPPLNITADADYGSEVDLGALDLNGYGFRWIRLRRDP
ncbi:alpha-amylase family protein [Streptosporangium sandarakinum]|uniref:Alpha-amylase n=1 Tax=Streptosporangium sandarakinum TaxID=1260955 RepID=A0A852UYR2_9ACTN|nr:alpha-amylase family protein [Streptosporangium sandarakinum]NYF41080.1 maltose alpha-D-glucosyltransferase/alpha-amylase [Streptosporangium sandarakinum]